MAIHHCRDCNSTMKEGETTCWACGSVVKPPELPLGLGRRFASLINFFFIVSLVLSVASLFFDATPPFSKCITVTLVLFLVKSSASQMLERKKT